MESTRVRCLPRPDRAVQTTLPAPIAGTLPTKQSAATRFRIRLPLELQGSTLDGRGTQVMPTDSRTLAVKICETTNKESRLPDNQSPIAVGSFHGAAGQESRPCQSCRSVPADN